MYSSVMHFPLSVCIDKASNSLSTFMYICTLNQQHVAQGCCTCIYANNKYFNVAKVTFQLTSMHLHSACAHCAGMATANAKVNVTSHTHIHKYAEAYTHT